MATVKQNNSVATGRNLQRNRAQDEQPPASTGWVREERKETQTNSDWFRCGFNGKSMTATITNTNMKRVKTAADADVLSSSLQQAN